MSMVRWLALLSAIVGTGMGLTYVWLIAPPSLSASSPEMLRADYRDQYRVAIAAAYSATGDLPRARARLALLGDTDPIEALAAQAQRMLASGQPFDEARQIALLASDLQAGTTSIASAPRSDPQPFPAASSGPPAGSSTAVEDPAALPGGPEASPPAAIVATPVATRTPFANPSAPFKLISRQDVCEPNSPAGQLRITVLDRAGQPMPGVELTITWTDGEERFFTGLQPDIGEGYADFIMRPGSTYALRVARVGAPISGLFAPACPAAQAGGSGFIGGLEITLQEP